MKKWNLLKLHYFPSSIKYYLLIINGLLIISVQDFNMFLFLSKKINTPSLLFTTIFNAYYCPHRSNKASKLYNCYISFSAYWTCDQFVEIKFSDRYLFVCDYLFGIHFKMMGRAGFKFYKFSLRPEPATRLSRPG